MLTCVRFARRGRDETVSHNTKEQTIGVGIARTQIEVELGEFRMWRQNI
jgi:hypothetical protein